MTALLHKTVALAFVVVAMAACASRQPDPATPSSTTPSAESTSTASACETVGGKCTIVTATVVCKSQPDLACATDEFCCMR